MENELKRIALPRTIPPNLPDLRLSNLTVKIALLDEGRTFPSLLDEPTIRQLQKFATAFFIRSRLLG